MNNNLKQYTKFMNKYQYKVQGVDYDVEIEEVDGNLATVSHKHTK